MTIEVLTETMQRIRSRGLRGLVIFDQGGTTTPYVAICVDGTGKPVDPRSEETHDTPLAAIEDLARKL